MLFKCIFFYKKLFYDSLETECNLNMQLIAVLTKNKRQFYYCMIL